jgi:hypothetical protein
MKERGRFGVPMADNERERKTQVPIAGVKRAVPRHLVFALLKQSGEVAPVDLGRFGKRAGQIIAQGASARHDETESENIGRGRSSRGRYGAL